MIETKDIEIKELDVGSIARWNEYVQNATDTTFFHLAEWKEVLERAFGHNTYFIYAEKNGKVMGVLPLGHVRSRLFGNALISNPFCVYGGASAVSDDIRQLLETRAVELANNLNVDYLELRYMDENSNDWQTKDLYVTFIKEIEPDPDKNLQAIPRRQRRMVRKAMEKGLRSEVDNDLNNFYNSYSASVRNLGTPVFSKKYFRVLRDVFQNKCEIMSVYKENRLISSVMSFYFKDQVLPYYGGGTIEARTYNANDFMYWELMRMSAERGVRTFDYGRSKRGVGSYSFKKNWGFEPKPLNYRYQLIKASSVPDLNPLNPKYRLFINLWKKLPLSVANTLGPYISKSLG
jgi:FemAB-related protein (PEP-CTERM system-associated)